MKGFQHHHINENNINHWSGTPNLSEMGNGVSVDCLSLICFIDWLIGCCLVIDFDSSLRFWFKGSTFFEKKSLNSLVFRLSCRIDKVLLMMTLTTQAKKETR